MVAHKEFATAGKAPGLQVWRIENMDLKPVPKNLYGNFYTGDAYLLLHTTAAPSYSIHMWLGDECSQDESGAAAIFSTQLDDFLGGSPVQYREVQNNESVSFLGYFKSGIKYKVFPLPQAAFRLCLFSILCWTESEMYSPALLQISDATGSMKTSVVAQSSPFKQAMLLDEECYILDNGADNNVFVWKGPKANPEERKAAMKVAQDFIKSKNYSNKTQIQVMPAGGETTLFRQFFSDWRDKDQTTGPSKAFTIGKIAQVKQIPFDASTLHSNNTMAAQHNMVDDGSGKVQVSVQNQPITTIHSSLKSITVIIYQFLIVNPSASSLNTNDVFVLKTPDSLFVWRGVGASADESDAAKHVVSFLGGKPTDVAEGKEPAGFWSALGGKAEYQSSKTLQKVVKPPRLFGCSNKTGRLVVEEVPGDFTQSDLATDDVMLLDTWDQIFLWVGNDANEVEKTGAPKIAKEYVDSDPSGRRGIPITTIKQGAEPPTFTGWFQAWDSKMWDSDPLDRIRARF
uniref:Scinderin like b n=1 Tax=Astyanax mexicanus TaxID=7994 RepID=A0A8B9L655_ASTMX